MLRLQRVVEPDQVGFRLLSREALGGRQISQHLQGTSTNELVRLRRLDHAFEAVEIAIIDADQDAFEGCRDAVAQHRFNSLTVLRKTAQEREHARVLPLAREVEEEEDSPRGVTRPIRTAGVAFQHAEQSGGGLIPMVECPLHGLAGQIVTGAPEGLDRGLKVHGKAPSLQGAARPVVAGRRVFAREGRMVWLPALVRIRGELTATVSRSATEAVESHGTRLISPCLGLGTNSKIEAVIPPRILMPRHLPWWPAQPSSSRRAARPVG